MNTTDYTTTTVKNPIGLNAEYTSLLTERLNDLLANYQVFYQNVRGFHWNIKGNKFFELHVKFEELYTNLQEKIDELAERVVTLGGTPLHSFSDYLKTTEVQEVKNVSNDLEGVSSILSTFKLVITKQRELLRLSAEADDEGTNSLMSDYIREQEKLVWMYGAYLKN